MKYIILVMLLSSCASLIKPPVQVLVPIPVPCLAVDMIPEQPELQRLDLSKDDDIFTKVNTILSDALKLEADNNILRALVQSCLTSV
jgi:hypothetical protein